METKWQDRDQNPGSAVESFASSPVNTLSACKCRLTNRIPLLTKSPVFDGGLVVTSGTSLEMGCREISYVARARSWGTTASIATSLFKPSTWPVNVHARLVPRDNQGYSRNSCFCSGLSSACRRQALPIVCQEYIGGSAQGKRISWI